MRALAVSCSGNGQYRTSAITSCTDGHRCRKVNATSCCLATIGGSGDEQQRGGGICWIDHEMVGPAFFALPSTHFRRDAGRPRGRRGPRQKPPAGAGGFLSSAFPSGCPRQRATGADFSSIADALSAMRRARMTSQRASRNSPMNVNEVTSVQVPSESTAPRLSVV